MYMLAGPEPETQIQLVLSARSVATPLRKDESGYTAAHYAARAGKSKEEND